MADDLDPPPPTLWVGGHPAIDLLNTVLRQRGEAIDLLQTDHDVLAWLTHAAVLPEPAPTAHLPPEHLTPDHLTPDHLTPDHLTPDHLTPDRLTPDQLPPGQLLRAARRLREAVRAIVTARNAGTPPDLAPLNRLLAATSRTAELHLDGDNTITRQERITGRPPERLLAPLTAAAADLLSTTSPHQLRHCEGAGCVLWFFDETPSQRRRWCSMELCGNRAKVATFRARHPLTVQAPASKRRRPLRNT